MISTLFLCGVAVAPPAPASPSILEPAPVVAPALDAFGDAKKASEKNHLERLVELASWCHKQKAFLQRDQVYEIVLELDPDHKAARKYLKFVKDRKSGKWIRKRPYRAPKPGKPDVVKQYQEKRRAVDGALVEARIALVEMHAETLGPTRRDTELRALLELAPEHEELRGMLGYVKVEKPGGKTGWTTQVALETDKRRDALLEALEEARDAVTPAEECDEDRVDESLDIAWEGLMKTKRVRAIANTDEEEAELVAETVDATLSFLPFVCGGKLRVPSKYTVYLIDGDSDKSAFIENCPRLSDSARERLYGLGSTWIPRTARVACWSDSDVVRLDQSVKQSTVRYLGRSYGITTERGWLVEGVGLYVNQIVLGTRYSRHVAQTNYVDQSEPRINTDLNDPDADWIEIAAEYMGEVKPTRLASTFGRNTSEMSPEDVVLAYAFVSYLREGFGVEMLEKVLRKVGSGEASGVVVLEELMEAKLPEIQRRFHEWLNEVGSQPF